MTFTQLKCLLFKEHDCVYFGHISKLKQVFQFWYMTLYELMSNIVQESVVIYSASKVCLFIEGDSLNWNEYTN